MLNPGESAPPGEEIARSPSHKVVHVFSPPSGSNWPERYGGIAARKPKSP